MKIEEKLSKMFQHVNSTKKSWETSGFMAFCFGVLKSTATKRQLSVIEEEFKKITTPKEVSDIETSDDECWFARSDWRGVVVIRELPSKLKAIRNDLIKLGYKEQ